ncbi:hypothetical protein R9X50_00348900 [Acrodontium crateriforme]|uniref:NAD-dependent epimerase/dehydratase domain-containing protein n=1 Tax=Acrodontium crateriforme TaxID=150365 RepID=A0AAQ3R7H5_9PEZI|nr:hypothetical protein R9X50_00348900 [Acrodontium crateriforme]
MANPNVLVTGASGHLGYALMLDLQNHGFRPIGLDIIKSENTELVGNIADRAFVANTFATYPSLRFVLHTATLHKPHVGSHTKEAFIETNIKGTLVLLEEASRTNHIEGFIYTSTTSTFGAALAPAPGQPAAWIDELVTPIPKNIYGTTKIAAEDMCYLIHAETKMPVLVLKTSRFFPEQDDNETSRNAFDDDNLKVCELMYRRVDVADVVGAHVCAMRRAKAIGWGKYIISAPPPFQRDQATLDGLNSHAADVIDRVRPQQYKDLVSRGWRIPERLDRVYDSSKAIRDLQWSPEYTFERAVEHVAENKEWRSALSIQVGKRGYHATPTGIYTS